MIKDSGERREFTTGSVRDKRDGKGRYDLLPAYVIGRDAKHIEAGAVKYGPRNWEKGQPLSSYLDSALRHLFVWMDGDREEDNLAAARWNIAALMWTEEMIRRGHLPPEMNDIGCFTAHAVKQPEKPQWCIACRGKGYWIEEDQYISCGCPTGKELIAKHEQYRNAARKGVDK